MPQKSRRSTRSSSTPKSRCNSRLKVGGAVRQKKELVEELKERISRVPLCGNQSEVCPPLSNDPTELGLELKLRLGAHAPVFRETFHGKKSTIQEMKTKYISIPVLSINKDQECLVQARIRRRRLDEDGQVLVKDGR